MRLAAAILAGTIALGCVDDGPSEPAGHSVQVAISARITGLEQRVSYRLQVHAAYRLTSGELVDLNVTPSDPFPISPGTSTHSAAVDITPCLNDPLRETPDPDACLLVVRLELLDDGGSILATANQDAPNPVKRGASVTLGTVELSPLPSTTPILLDPVVVDFATTTNATAIPGSQTVTISTSEGGTLTGITVGSFTYRPSGVEWLQSPTIDQASATSGAPATLTLQPSTTGLPPGEYSATISISAASGASNSPQSITVNYQVAEATAPPTIVLTPASLNFGPVPRAAAIPAPKQVTIQSSTGAAIAPLSLSDIKYDPADVSAWLNASLNSDGSILTLTPTTTDLEPRTYTATITVNSGVTGVEPQSVRVTYVVQPPTPLPPSRLTIALQPDTLLVGQTAVATATVTDANGTVFRTLPPGAVITWTSSDPTVIGNPTPSSPLAASATALRPGTTTISAILTLADQTTIASNAVPVTVNARQFTLTVHLTGNGAGTVSSLESRIPLIQCTWNGSAASGTCSAAYPEGQTVSLSATAETNSTFDHWDEACAGTEGAECSITMNDNKSVTAAFALTSAGSIVGVTRSAVDASPVPAASVELRAGANDTTSEPLSTTRSGADGSYSFTGLAAGTYTAVARATGYITGVASEIVVTGDAPTTQDIVLSPVLLEGQTRIVLTWGESPRDLDAHLFAPSNLTNYHVFYDSKGSLDTQPFAILDIDDQSGNGPETITIGQQQSGVYRFLVHDYSDGDSFESAALAQSGAHVQVLQGDRLVAQFDVPQHDGITWTVFELNGSTITPVNTMDYSDPTVVLLSRQGSSAAQHRSKLKATK